MDKRTRLGRAMNAYGHELVEDFGGMAGISARQRGSVRLAVTLKVLIDSGLAWALAQSSLVNGRRRSFYPIVGELAALLTRYQAVMKDLGLEKRLPPPKTLTEILREREAEREAQAAATREGAAQ